MEWAAELYAHAIAVEREAALRYAELAWRMIDQGSEEAARLFAEFAGLQAIHLAALRRRTQGIPLPDLTSDHSWPEQGAPVANALQAERDARAFFEQARRIAQEPAARALAEEMAGEENEHIARLERLMESSPCTGTS
jgi:rubrerythrin